MPTLDEKYVQSLWDELRDGIQAIQYKNEIGLSFEKLYTNAYTMVLYKYGDKLYAGLRQVITHHMHNKVRGDVIEALNSSSLETLNLVWNDHTTSSRVIGEVLMYMDRVYVPQQTETVSAYALGLMIFKDEVIRHGDIMDKLRNILLDLITRERNGEVIQKLAIQKACKMLSDINIYEEDFEVAFLQQIADFYKEESQLFLAENNASMYIKRVEKCLQDEIDRAKLYLASSSEQKIVEVLEKELITEHLTKIVEMKDSGVEHMLMHDRIHDLHCMYKLLKRVPMGIETLNSIVSSNFQFKLQSLVCKLDPKTPVLYIQTVLDLKDRFDHFLDASFENEIMIEEKIASDFEQFLNIEDKIPEYLSLFIDDKLKKGTKMLTEAEVEVLLEKAMVLFRFMTKKDEFKRYYTKHLAKRLLLEKSLSDEMERNMISKLKTVCGCQFTYKLERMLKDMRVSSTLMENYIASAKESSVSTYQMVVLMLFNNRATYTYKEISEETQVPFKELKRVIQSLAIGKVTQRILTRRGHSKDIVEDDEFCVNDQFSSRLNKVKIQTVAGKESEPETRKFKGKVVEDCKHEIEATVVRVMKAHKQLQHNALVEEVTNQLSHRLSLDDDHIKKRIDCLIEREYLSRDENDLRLYHHVT